MQAKLIGNTCSYSYLRNYNLNNVYVNDIYSKPTSCPQKPIIPAKGIFILSINIVS